MEMDGNSSDATTAGKRTGPRTIGTNPRESQFLRRQQERLNGLKTRETVTQQYQTPTPHLSSGVVVETPTSSSFSNQEPQSSVPTAWRENNDETNEKQSALLEQQISEWKTKVQQQHHLSDQNNDPNRPATTRRQNFRELCWKFGQWQKELYDLRNQFLESPLVVAVIAPPPHTPSRGDAEPAAGTQEHDETTKNGSVNSSYYSKFHTEFSACQTLLDQARTQLLPKNRGKFVFLRYHEAVMQRKLLGMETKEKRNETMTTSDTNNNNNHSNNKMAEQNSNASPHRLNGYRHVTISIHCDRMRVQRKQQPPTTTTTTTTGITQNEEVPDKNPANDDGVDSSSSSSSSCWNPIDQPPVILTNLEDCHVIYNNNDDKNSMNFANIHLVDCKSLRLTFGGSDDDDDITTTTTSCDSGNDNNNKGNHGTSNRPCPTTVPSSYQTPILAAGGVVNIQALHVTNCIDCTFEGGGGAVATTTTIQQIRLHDSSSLIIRGCHVTAGAILEGCQKVQFHDIDREKIRDFHWLKPGLPSPNFSVIMSPPASTSLPPMRKQQLEQDTGFKEGESSDIVCGTSTSATSVQSPNGATESKERGGSITENIDSDDEL